MRVLLLASLLIAHRALGGQLPADDPLQEMLADAPLMQQLAHLTQRAAALKPLNAEVGGFVLRQNDRLILRLWPVDRGALRTSYRGVLPSNLVAIVHTHPEGRMFPSRRDMREARRLRIAICVLTRRAIWVAHPSSDHPLMLLNEPGWTGVSRGVAEE